MTYPEPESARETVGRIVGVYDADGTWRGEVAYWIGARLGRAHCALCEITHSPFREKTRWNECAGGMPVPFETVHRDEQSAALEAVTGGRVPCVVVETDRRLVVLLEAGALEACDGEPEALAAAIETEVAVLGLDWS